MNHQSLLIQRVCLQSVVISFFRFAEFIKKENYSLHTQDQDNSSNETGCIKGRLSHRLWGWSHSGICCTWCSNCLGSCRRGGLNCGFSCRIGCWHQSGCGHYRTEVCRVPHLTITNCWVMWTIALICWRGWGGVEKRDKQHQPPICITFDFATKLYDIKPKHFRSGGGNNHQL